MRNLHIIIALIFSCNLTAQNLKIETEFVLLGMINDHWMTKNGDCKYHIDTYTKKDSLQFQDFLHYSNIFFQENSLQSDLIIETDEYGNITISSKILTQELKDLFIIKANYYKFYNQLFRKRFTRKCGDKRQKDFIRTTNFKKLKTFEQKLSFVKGAFLRNGKFYNDTIEFLYIKNYYFKNNKLKSNPEIIVNILKPYKDEFRNIEFIENIYPLRTIVTLRLYYQLIDHERLKRRAIKPKPNTMGPHRPNPIEYLGIEEKTNANSKL